MHRAKVRHPHQAGGTWGNHRGRGGEVSLLMSSSARSNIMSAPAAAEDASQAIAMSFDSTALRRVFAALMAMFAAVTKSSRAASTSEGGTMLASAVVADDIRRSSTARDAGAGPASARMSSSHAFDASIGAIAGLMAMRYF